MIKSIKFTGKSKEKNYIQKNEVLKKTLAGKTFKFSSDKINVLFGPNACGKSTIIKALAAYCMCGNDLKTQDGLTSYRKIEPIEYGFGDDKKTNEALLEIIRKTAGNEMKVDWDGGFVYNNNFGARRSCAFGDLSGSIFDENDELLYIMNKDKSSLGQQSIMFINKITQLCTGLKEPFKMMEADYLKTITHINSAWETAYRLSYEYIKRHQTSDDAQLTVLLDEIDKSLDINNIILLYTKLLPVLIEKYNIQVILVSHSPVILSDAIFNNPAYNIISLDEKYTETVRENLKKIF